MWSRPQPHRHDISARLKLGVIMSSMATPQTAINCRRNISGPLQILPSLSSLAFISETKRSSSELVDLAAAHSESITRTRRTTRSDSIETTRVLAAPASSGTIILILPWNIDPKSFQKSRTKQFPFRGLRTIGPGQIHDRPADGGLKTSAIERALAQSQCCSCSSSSLTKG